MWWTAKTSMMTGRRATIAWTPASLGTALKLWLDASDSGTITIAGTGVSQWADKSGNANHATQTTDGNKPSVASAIQNGLDAIFFDAVNHFTFALPDFASGFPAASMIAVSKILNDPPSGTGNNAGPLIQLGSNAQGTHWPFTDGNIYDHFAATTRKACGNPTASMAAWYLVSIRSATNDWEFYINGTSLFADAGSGVGFTTAPFIAFTSIGSHYYDGHLGEMIITNTALVTLDRQKAEGYLAHKWGITSILDAGHPYKTSPP